MTDDDRHPVILNTAAAPSPDYVHEVSAAVPQAIRVLNEQTRHPEAIQEPQDAHQVVLDMDMAASRLPQLLHQIASWYEREAAAGRLEVVSGDRKGAPAMAVVAIRMRADAARMAAEQLSADLASVAQVTACLAAAQVREDGEDER